MNIVPHQIKIKDIIKGYINDEEDGVVAYGGLLNVRPKYQREFVYSKEQQHDVIDTIFKKYPLNVMYWIKNEDGTFEILDGQQRTMSICQYAKSKFSYKGKYYHNLLDPYLNDFLEYQLTVYFCEDGNDVEKIEWFHTINIAGEKLTPQEGLNAIYTGTWLSDAKRYFSKTGGAAYAIGGAYLVGTPNRQHYLETVLKWISNDNIIDYMAVHQLDENAKELWDYFNEVMNWVNDTFKVYRKEMKGIQWGALYNSYKDNELEADKVELWILDLIDNDEVQSTKGIYLYILTGDEKHLNLRTFDIKTKRKVYEKQKGKCPVCKKHFEFEEMDGDHITPWHKGGKTVLENCLMLCRKDNLTKSGK